MSKPWLQVRPIANMILTEGRSDPGSDPNTGVMVMLEMVIMHVMVLLIDKNSYNDFLDDMVVNLKNHLPDVRQDAIDVGIIDEIKPN